MRSSSDRASDVGITNHEKKTTIKRNFGKSRQCGPLPLNTLYILGELCTLLPVCWARKVFEITDHFRKCRVAVPDPDLEVRNGRSFRPLDKGRGVGGRSPKKFFRPLGPQFGLKIRGTPPLDPPLSGSSPLLTPYLRA